MDFLVKSVNVLVCSLLVLNWLMEFGSIAQRILPEQEVAALQAISRELKELNWNVHQNSCDSGDGFFNRVIVPKRIVNTVTCNCTPLCHVTYIELKRLNLSGVLPAAFGNLTQLRELDLTHNLIHGTIPREFARLPLVKFAMLGNQLSGQIPSEIGDIASLEELVLQDNQLGGNLPESLGKLNSLRRLVLSGNNFTGTIPESYGNLRNLTDFRIDGNDVSGKLPKFIGNWTKLDRLDIQGTSMENPIPRAISELKNLTALRITDLKGSPTSFPNLTQLTSLKELVLRNCLIEDRIPGYIGLFNNLITLDLSFNRLNGSIPETFQSLNSNNNNKLKGFLFLTNNSLSGQVPSWMANSKINIDLSYNNFNGSPVSSCQLSNLNLASSYSRTTNETIAWCMRKDLPCPIETRFHSLFINCGGERMDLDGNAYEDDLTLGGKSNFFSFSDRWAYSSTGAFLDNEDANYKVTSTNVPASGILYATARIAPLSLKYYGLCLRKGSYHVKLHFAEIMFTDDQTFRRVGERIFDISIQGKLVRKDFNIKEKAKGVGKSYIVEETNVLVNGSTLEIHLYWAGKGTSASPDRGIYGPLISAITVTPAEYDSELPPEGRHTLPAGIVVGIVAAVTFFTFFILGVLWWRRCAGRKSTLQRDLKGLNLQIGSFTLKQIKAATNNFDPSNKIGEGGFGPVYKGVLLDGTIIAVKQLSSKSDQGNREFVNEIGMISSLQHPNLVKLYGCCAEGNQLLLVYEYMENNSLARALFGSKEFQLELDWPTRQQICIGIARGLAYLHEESRLKIVHRDIKGTNVLLDKNLNPKISDFGLAKLFEEEKTHMSTRVAGTFGYMAPEYATRGHLTEKADVYSFGVVALC